MQEGRVVGLTRSCVEKGARGVDALDIGSTKIDGVLCNGKAGQNVDCYYCVMSVGLLSCFAGSAEANGMQGSVIEQHK